MASTNLQARWAKIQETRRKNPRTREPEAGSLGLAWMINRIKHTVEKVAVMSRSSLNEQITIQRATGGQILEVSLSDLRTEDELWAGATKVAPELLPKIKGKPGTSNRWNPSRLPATVINKVWEATA
jgi:hypothetical protein